MSILLSMREALGAWGVFLALTIEVALGATSPGQDLFDAFAPGWEAAWRERSLSRRDNDFGIDTTMCDRCLRIDSDGSASAIWRPVELDAEGKTPIVSWRWKVADVLDVRKDERGRAGDDYAARLAVVFDGEPFRRGSRVLMYVWARAEEVGNVYPSPYSESVGTFVLRNRETPVGSWRFESRDVVRDFEAYFGESPGRITGVALMVDTDNTGSEATAWFDDLRLEEARVGDVNNEEGRPRSPASSP